jgi:hypothetical protein
VAELSRLLTGDRSERNDGYLGNPALLSAYLRYFLPWNVYRLARLLPALPLFLADGDAVTDLGSGPLTLPLALWITRPDLRTRGLEFRCLDRTPSVLEAGKKLFRALAGPAVPWKIRTIHASLGETVKGKRAALVTAVNVFDEVFRHIPRGDLPALRRETDKQARLLAALTSEAGSILVVEPGIPRSGEFISLLRASLLEGRRVLRSPCPHGGICPLGGGNPGKVPHKAAGKGKWCHFAFDTEDAPRALLKLSAAAGLPKERATLSFLLAGPPEGNNPHAGDSRRPAGGGEEAAPLPGETLVPARILSDAFPLPQNRYGRYGCSERGLVLVSGEKTIVDRSVSGTLCPVVLRVRESRDQKSGALRAEIQV